MELILLRNFIAATSLLLSTSAAFGQPLLELPKAQDGFCVQVTLLGVSPRMPYDEIPLPLYQPIPNYPMDPSNGKRTSGYIIVSFIVNKQGKVQDCKPVDVENFFWESVKEAVNKWTFFMPPRADDSDNKPVILRYIIHFIKCKED